MDLLRCILAAVFTCTYSCSRFSIFVVAFFVCFVLTYLFVSVLNTVYVCRPSVDSLVH